MATNIPFPAPTAPIVDKSGRMTPAFLSYLQALFNRTGGASGVNISTVQTTANEALITAVGALAEAELAAAAAGMISQNGTIAAPYLFATAGLDGLVPVPAAPSETLSGWLSSYLNVKAFGAKGDGVADDTQAIQAAINAGGRVYFPSGNYVVKGTLALPANACLAGIESRTSITTGGYNFPLFSINGSGVTVRNFAIYNAAKAGGVDFLINCGSNALDHIFISNVVSYGGFGFLTDSGALATGYYTNLTVEECQVFAPQGSGVAMFRCFAFIFFRKFAVSYVGQSNSNFAGFAADCSSMAGLGAVGGLLLEDVDIEGTSGSTISGISSWPQQHGFFFNAVTELWMRRCEADTMDGYGLNFTGCEWVHLDNLHLALCNNHSLVFTTTTKVTGSLLRIFGRLGLPGATASCDGILFNGTGNGEVVLSGVRIHTQTGSGVHKNAAQSSAVTITGFQVVGCSGYGVATVGDSAFLMTGGAFAANTAGNYSLGGIYDYLMSSQLNSGSVVTSVGPGPVSG